MFAYAWNSAKSYVHVTVKVANHKGSERYRLIPGCHLSLILYWIVCNCIQGTKRFMSYFFFSIFAPHIIILIIIITILFRLIFRPSPTVGYHRSLFVVSHVPGVSLGRVAVGHYGHGHWWNGLFRFFLLVLAVVRCSFERHSFLPVWVAYQTSKG